MNRDGYTLKWVTQCYRGTLVDYDAALYFIRAIWKEREGRKGGD